MKGSFLFIYCRVPGKVLLLGSLFISWGGHFIRDSFVPYIALFVYQSFKLKYFLCFDSLDNFDRCDGFLDRSILLV